MWLMTKHGFYSIVQKKPGEYHMAPQLRTLSSSSAERQRRSIIPAQGRTAAGPKGAVLPWVSRPGSVANPERRCIMRSDARPVRCACVFRVFDGVRLWTKSTATAVACSASPSATP